MGEPTLAAQSPETPSESRLDSWKEIAAYLNRDVTTVQRWEKREGMPVHRHLHDRAGSVYAFRYELDAWAHSRNLRGSQGQLSNESAASAEEAVSSKGPFRLFRKWPVGISAATVLLMVGFGMWLHSRDFFWRNPLASAQFQTITDSERDVEAVAVSRDGQFVAFLSDRDGHQDVWVTQLGSGQFHNLTHGAISEIVNPSVRTLGFSPDGSLVTFWVRQPKEQGGGIGIWAVPTLGGEAKLYLDGVAEFDWSSDATKLAYHTPGAGDPLYVSDGNRRPGDRAIFTAPAGLHSHFPVWDKTGKHLYFVMGALPDKLDIWRIPATGGNPERITSHSSNVSHPVLLDRHTLMYLAGDPDGSGPWLYSTDVEHRIPHRVAFGIDRYTSLATTADGRNLVAVLAHQKKSLWRLKIPDSLDEVAAPVAVPIAASMGSSPRLGPGYLLYVSATGANESIQKLSGGNETELWKGEGAHVLGGPAISPDGNQIAFAVLTKGKSLLYVIGADGTGSRILSDSMDLRSGPAWSPDGRAITIAAEDQGLPHLFRIPLSGEPSSPLLGEYSTDPAWSPDGQFVVFSGPDIGTQFAVKAATATGKAHPLPSLLLTRGARHMEFLPQGLVYLRGDLEHKNLWLLNLETGAERQLTNLSPDFQVSDFDISSDGHEVVLEREQESSQIVRINRVQ